MSELVILSGKGGTGKTTVAASLFALAQHAGLGPVAVDCDVDAANLYLVLNPTMLQQQDFRGGSLAVVDQVTCIRCGLCVEKCLFRAMPEAGVVDPYACEGCGVCALVCPVSAVSINERVTGTIQLGRSKWGDVVWARLQPGAGNSGKLVAAVRAQARARQGPETSNLIISDGPPGLGCPVVSALTGASMALLVTEPSVSGYHDLVRVAELCHHFGVPATVVVNKADLAPETSAEITAWSTDQGLPVLGEIPFDPQVPASIALGQPLVASPATAEGPAALAVTALWRALSTLLELEPCRPTAPATDNGRLTS